MSTSALLKSDDERATSDYAAGEGFRVIQGGAEAAQAREDPYKRNELPVEPRYEVIDGVVYMMAGAKFWHQKVFSKMYLQLEQQLAPHGCEVIQSPFDVYLFWAAGDQKNFVEPDLFIACDQEQLKRLNASEQDYYHGAPKFIVEVLSPSNTEHDLVRKAELYYRASVAEYWAVDPIGHTIHLFTLPEDGAEYKLKIRGAKGVVPLVSFPGVTVDFSAIFGETLASPSPAL